MFTGSFTFTRANGESVDVKFGFFAPREDDGIEIDFWEVNRGVELTEEEEESLDNGELCEVMQELAHDILAEAE